MEFKSIIMPINLSEGDLDLDECKKDYNISFTPLPYSNYIGDTYYVVNGKKNDIVKFIKEGYDDSFNINDFPEFVLEK